MNAPRLLTVAAVFEAAGRCRSDRTSSPDELAAFVETEMERWARVVDRAGIRVEQ